MPEQSLQGLKVAILATDGFEQSELMEPRHALTAAGATAQVVSPKQGSIRGWRHANWSDDQVPVDIALEQASAEQFDALLLPGGVMNPDALRMQPRAVAFVRAFFDARKPVGAICHGPWSVIEAHAVAGRRMTSWPSLKTDLENAGAQWLDQAVVVDDNLVTSRKPEDIPAFNRELIRLIGGARSAQAPNPKRSQSS